MNRIIILVTLVTATFSLVAQHQYTPEACRSFVRVYMGQKESHETSPDKFRALLEKHGIDKEAYASVLRGDSSGAKLRNEEKFQKLHLDILEENERLEEAREQSTRNACTEVQLPYETYREMLHRYKTGIAFQRALKPYFDDYFKSLK